jgi:NAD(P)-dependent dehydrogenase (short-subunit alcohol dehydrogenase family)
MQDLDGRTAFVTGGASGIGFAVAKGFLEAGMNVMIADIEERALDAALAKLANYGNRLGGLVLDVSLREAYAAAAAETLARFGKVHVLFNNAGVSRAGRIETIAPSDWDWVWGVNVGGTVAGIQILLPHIRAHGEGGHIVSTASIAGLAGSALSGAYSSTKFAIVGLSEVLAEELKDTGIGVSVLCPGFVRTNMTDNGRNRPARYGGAFDVFADPALQERNARYRALTATALDPDLVAPMVIRAIRENRLYIVTDPERRDLVETRHARLREAFDAAAEDLAASTPG